MTEYSPTRHSDLVNIALGSLAQRNDPLITRINNGEILTNLESKSLAMDLYNLASIMQVSSTVIDELEHKLVTKNSEIDLMKTLLGLSETEPDDR